MLTIFTSSTKALKTVMEGTKQKNGTAMAKNQNEIYVKCKQFTTILMVRQTDKRKKNGRFVCLSTATASYSTTEERAKIHLMNSFPGRKEGERLLLLLWVYSYDVETFIEMYYLTFARVAIRAIWNQ